MSATATTIKPKITGMDTVAYLIKDVARARRFYEDTLGLTVETEFPQGAEYELSDGTTFSLWKMDDGTWHPSAGIMFHVDDVKAAVAYYRANGVTIIEDAFDTGGCIMAVAQDSEENTFIVHARNAK